MVTRAVIDVLPKLLATNALPAWPAHLRTLSEHFLDDWDSGDLAVRERLRAPFERVHIAWLTLCLSHTSQKREGLG